MSEQTFGAWLLAQTAREDSIGSMARSWKQLKEARGYKHSQEKSVRELLSAMFGEDWAHMQGDEVMTAAVAEWRGDFDKPEQDDQLRIPGFPGMLPDAVASHREYASEPADGRPSIGPLPALDTAPGKVVLVINGYDVELPPGRYNLAIVVQPAEVDEQQFADAVADAVTSAYPLSPAGVDWNALFRHADLAALPEE